MKDWKEWFDSMLVIRDAEIYKVNPVNAAISDEEERYKAFLARMIDEGYIEANPKRWVRPKRDDVYSIFSRKLPNGTHPVNIKLMSDAFYNHWEAVNWFRGKGRIKSIPASINTWIENNEKYKRNDSRKVDQYDHESTEWEV